MQRIETLPEQDRPREKLLRKGVTSLSDRELLAVVLNRGTSGQPIHVLAGEVLKLLDREATVPEIEALVKIRGIGPTRAAQLVAAMEFARRRMGGTGIKIRKPSELLPLVRHYADRKQEHFLVSSLNGNNEIIATRVVSVGLVDRSVVHPREVFAEPITDRAASIVVAHNHPNGSVEPSRQDTAVTRRLVQAGVLLGIPVLDHLVFTHNDYYSFAENDAMPD